MPESSNNGPGSQDGPVQDAPSQEPLRTGSYPAPKPFVINKPAPLDAEDGGQGSYLPPEQSDSSGSYLSPDETGTGKAAPKEPSPHDTQIRNTKGDALCQDTRTQQIKPPDMNVVFEGQQRRLLKISCHKCMQKLDVTFLEPFAHFNCPSCDIDLIVPKWFDNYLLEEPGGIGGMAIVYRALDLALDREVAIKVLNPEVASEKERSELFLHEARTAATINHYAVVPIYTCGVYEGQPYIVMQYMGGGSLEVKLKLSRGLLPVSEVARWIRDVAEGLDNAKRHGIVHHDIKPGNIMLDIDGNAKIGDFGIAQAVNDRRNSQIFEMTKSWVSPNYVSPEKISTGKEDFFGDIYSLGATFYHLLTGFTPFSNTDIDELIRMRLKSDPVPPHQHRPEIPPQISRLILSMMDREPDKRPHYREIVKSLSEFLKNFDSKGRPLAKTPKIKPVSVDRDKLESAFDGKAPKRGHPVILGINLLLFLAVCGGAFFAWKNGILNKYFPGLPTPPGMTRQNDDADSDKLPEATKAFAAGDPAKACEIAEAAFEDIDAQPGKRIQAAVQLAIGNYLLKKPKAKENCIFISERLEAILARPDSSDAGFQSPESSPYQEIVSFLAKLEIKPDELKDRLSKADQSIKTAGALAILLRELYSPSSSKEALQSCYSNFHSAASLAPAGIWGNAWKGRLELWAQCIQTGCGDKEALEPLFAPLAKTLKKQPSPGALPSEAKTEGQGASQQAPETQKKGVTPQGLAPAAVSALQEKLTPLYLESIAPDFAQRRPRPEGLELPQAQVASYLSGIPDESRDAEKARVEIVASMKAYICRLMLRIPYDCDSFETKTGQLGKGVLMGNQNYLSFKPENGQRVRLKWEDVPAKEFIKIAEQYAKIREQAIADSILETDERKELAWDYLRLATLSSWYGLYGQAAGYGAKSLKCDQRLAKDIERLLLK